jgi:hypothetical protein
MNRTFLDDEGICMSDGILNHWDQIAELAEEIRDYIFHFIKQDKAQKEFDELEILYGDGMYDLLEEVGDSLWELKERGEQITHNAEQLYQVVENHKKYIGNCIDRDKRKDFDPSTYGPSMRERVML